MRRAKILATLGPSSNTQEKIEQLIYAGVNAVRINMSHGTQDEHAATVKAARVAAAKLNKPLAILVDLSGPKIRTRSLENKSPVQLETDALFTLTTRDIVGNDKEVSTTFKELPEAVKVGATILLDDGSLELRVEEVTETDVVCRIISGGLLYESKG
ncbi:MAG: pyruvate kinase, partial [Pyrinomonadaceae bacterium]